MKWRQNLQLIMPHLFIYIATVFPTSLCYMYNGVFFYGYMLHIWVVLYSTFVLVAKRYSTVWQWAIEYTVMQKYITIQDNRARSSSTVHRKHIQLYCACEIWWPFDVLNILHSHTCWCITRDTVWQLTFAKEIHWLSNKVPKTQCCDELSLYMAVIEKLSMNTASVLGTSELKIENTTKRIENTTKRIENTTNRIGNTTKR